MHSRSLAEITVSLGKRLEQMFGNQVSCTFVDVAGADMNRYPEVRQTLQSQQWPLPAVAVNGQMRFLATFSPLMIIREVEQQLNGDS